ncbi:unnamed protein product [Malus baccata var. baccata]
MEQYRLHTPDIVILLETKNNSRNYVHLKMRLQMEHLFAVEPRGIGGGLCVFWKAEVQVSLMNSEEFMIELKLWDESFNCPWRLFAIYASTDERKRRSQWESLSKKIEKDKDKCLILGDFNDILCNEEKEGGNFRGAASMRDFRDFVAGNELMDLGYEGYPFTWRNNRETLPIQQRLDRGLATHGWHDLFPDTILRHVVLEGSDHAMLLLSTEKFRAWRGRKFSFDGRWSKSEECRELVVGEWIDRTRGSHAYRFCEKIKTLRKSLKTWYKETGRNSKKKVELLKAEIRVALQSKDFSSGAVKQKEKELRVAHKDEELYWKTKSRNQWLNEGDKNTKFFHAQTLKRRRRNQIRGIEDSQGVWQEEDKEIADTAVGYFTELFQSSRPGQIEDIVRNVDARISPEDNNALTGPVTTAEIVLAVSQIPPSRAPGPDGFSGCFYQDHWNTVGEDVVKIIKAFWHSGTLLRQLNHTNLVLIPKVRCPKNMAQYRPIALCNVIYKILAKVLTNRLKLVMPKVIGDNQSAFVAGKQIQDNILVVHEVLHSLLHQRREDQAGMAIKLDMAKAYDRVEWNFLTSIMSKLGFSPTFCKWIKACISTVSFSIVVNGTPTGFIVPQRGLRQGDPLSPFLFLLCTEGLSVLLRKGLEQDALHGFKFTDTGTPITHLFFADDSVVFGNATVDEARAVAEALKVYACGSGQEVNLTKSSVFFSPKTPNRTKREIEETLGIQCKQGFGKYLGLQADFGHSKKAVFAEVRDKVEARLAGWTEQFLSQAGKEVLIKSVAMALPNYAMSCFKLPIGVCRDIEKAIRKFWWKGNEQRHGIHWVSWDRISKRKMSGGLGFKDIQCFNLAMLAKIGWRLTCYPTSLLATVLKDKYHPGCSFKEAGRGKLTSWGWKGIYEARKVLLKGIRWRVGNGQRINIRDDPWFPKPSTFRVCPYANLDATMVCDLIEPASNSWKDNRIFAGFHREDAETILSIPLSHFGCEDKLMWHYSVNGVYSVKSGYGIAREMMENGALGKKGLGAPSEPTQLKKVWSRIWRLQVPNKIKFFIWRCCNNALAVRRNIQRRHIRVDNVCGVCNAVDETENHLFFRCRFSHIFWFSSPLHLNSHELEGYDFLDSWGKFQAGMKGKENAEEICQEFAFGLWRLWKNRNDAVFKGLYRQPLDVMDLWWKNIIEFREASTCLGDTARNMVVNPLSATARPSLHWQRPRYGTIKINTDAAWCKATLRAGVGWVGRDFAGVLQAAGGLGTVRCLSAAAAEAIAIRNALQACITHRFNHVVIESDAKLIIQMIRKEVTVDCNLDCVLGDIEVLAQMLKSVTFAFVPRESNHAAHLVAKHVFKEGRDFIWDCIGPEFLFNALAKDVNLLIRI